MLKRFKEHMKKGDTLIEVMFAVGIFGLAAVGAISLMNKGLAASQNNLEITMARQEIDAQAEALRFIQNAYLTEKESIESTTDPDAEPNDKNNFRKLWKMIIDTAYEPSTYDKNTGKYSGGVVEEDPDFFTRIISRDSVCEGLFPTIPKNSFIINPRGLEKLSEIDPSDGNPIAMSENDIKKYVFTVKKEKPDAFTFSPVYPRLLYNGTSSSVDCQFNMSDACVHDQQISLNSDKAELGEAQSIWITAIKSESSIQCKDDDASKTRPDFYDFHIQTCWNSARGGASVSSSTIRLFNPDQIQTKQSSTLTFTSAGADVAFLLDVSGSMSVPIQQAASEIKSASETVINAGGRVALYTFSEIDCLINPDPYGCGSSDYEKVVQYCSFSDESCSKSADTIKNKVDWIPSHGMAVGSDIPESGAYGMAYIMAKETWENQNRAIVVLTDAPTKTDQQYDGIDGRESSVISKALELGVSVYVVYIDAWGSGSASNYGNITNSTNGKVYSVTLGGGGSGISEAFSDIAQQTTLTTTTENACF